MKTIDVKSMMIGFLLCAVGFLFMGFKWSHDEHNHYQHDLIWSRATVVNGYAEIVEEPFEDYFAWKQEIMFKVMRESRDKEIAEHLEHKHSLQID